MASSLLINNKEFITVKVAAEIFGYSRDHITRLAKGNKITALQNNRRWFVQVDSLQNYFEVQKLEAAARQSQLRLQRQRELSVRSAVVAAKTAGAQVSTRSNWSALTLSAAVFAVCVFAGFDLFGDTAMMTASVANAVPEAHISIGIVPVFTATESVTVPDGSRVVSKPEVTPTWTQITP